MKSTGNRGLSPIVVFPRSYATGETIRAGETRYGSHTMNLTLFLAQPWIIFIRLMPEGRIC